MTEHREMTILVVDDSPADRALLLEYLGRMGYHVELAQDGVEAWEFLSRESVDLILLDEVMPRMTGTELLRKIKQHPRLALVPVIFQSAANDRQQILEGIRAGAYYWLTKPYDAEMLQSIVEAAAEDRSRYKELLEEVRKGIDGMSLLRDATFVFRTIDEAHDLGTMLANSCPDPSKAVIGLTELLVNAVEHGNLGVTYAEKSQLHPDELLAEISRRMTLEENRGKDVEVRFERRNGAVRFTISDQGDGFDWGPYLQIDPQRAFHTHGRGIAVANLLSFDTLEYVGKGNVVVATVVTG